MGTPTPAESERTMTRSSEKRRVEAMGGTSSRKAPALGSAQGGRTALGKRQTTVGSPSAALAGCMGGMAMSPAAKAAEEDAADSVYDYAEAEGAGEEAGALPSALEAMEEEDDGFLN